MTTLFAFVGPSSPPFTLSIVVGLIIWWATR